MNKAIISICVNLISAVLIIIFSFFLLLFEKIGVSFTILVFLYLVFITKWNTPKVLLYEVFGKKKRKKLIDKLLNIFDEEDIDFSHEGFSVLGTKDQKYIVGIHSLKKVNRVIEYLVIIDLGKTWDHGPSFFPKKYDENLYNLVTQCDGKIEMIEDNLVQIVHGGNRWNYVLREEDIKKILEKMELNV